METGQLLSGSSGRMSFQGFPSGRPRKRGALHNRERLVTMATHISAGTAGMLFPLPVI